ncbi:peptidase M15 [Afipia sp. TerB]
MMNARRFSIVPVPVLRSAVVAAGIVGLLAVGSEGHQTTGVSWRTDLGVPSTTTQELATPSQPRSTSGHDLNQASLKFRVAMTEVSPGDVAHAPIAPDILDAAVEAASAHATNAPPTEPPHVDVASLNPSDAEPVDTGEITKSIEIVDECLVMDICVDRYLWALYQRTPKEDTIKVPERRKVSVKKKGKMVTVTRTFIKLVDQDFGWKDPKAAERVHLSMMNYVIGGMDRSFKLKLFYMLHAAEAAGFSPGITSGFRDDYRQSIASGLKAASNRSYHGGSLRGGYGHGLAADVVSTEGMTRNQRFASSARFWKWIDAHGKEFGIGRPYLGKDPPHVAPINGEEYAKHNRGTKQAASGVKKVKHVATSDHSHPVRRPRTVALSQR